MEGMNNSIGTAVDGLNRNAAHGEGGDLLQKFQPFTARCGIDRREAGDVAAWMREACDEAAADRISYDREHDWNCPRLASNLRLELRWGDGDPDMLRTFAKELVDLRPDALLGGSTAVTGALARLLCQPPSR